MSLSPSLRALRPLRLSSKPPHQRRTFFPNLVPPSISSNSEQVLTAQRLSLPHAPSQLFALIADIDSYSRFLPYCKVSRVTAWTPPSSSSSSHDLSKTWPTRADLTAGWGALEQTYTSRVFCVPGYTGSGHSSTDPAGGGIVEAISGTARTQIPSSVLAQHGLRDPGPEQPDPSSAAAVFESLVTRWTVSPSRTPPPTSTPTTATLTNSTTTGFDGSDVHLSLKFRFANPLYGALSSALADKVAPLMIEAFVERARRVLGNGS
ncbi:dehydrase and lipid transport-domain-containing protein [Camillea tinctor]|nr:dehydrase and lipid transport-domain-containing protein [Camillea tinctor]